jgi:hypothetical protein
VPKFGPTWDVPRKSPKKSTLAHARREKVQEALPDRSHSIDHDRKGLDVRYGDSGADGVPLAASRSSRTAVSASSSPAPGFTVEFVTS